MVGIRDIVVFVDGRPESAAIIEAWLPVLMSR
jgi:hypothetical protein